MKNSRYEEWLASSGYFDAIAVLANGPLHPGRAKPNTILANLLPWNGVRVLDVGGGTGWSHKFFASLGADIRTIEPNEWMRQRALLNGISPTKLSPSTVEEFGASSSSYVLDIDRVLVQGVTGFLEGGLNSLAPLFHNPGVRQFVFVEWIGPMIGQGTAPVLHTYSVSDYVRTATEAGFGDLWLQTYSYVDSCQLLSTSRVEKLLRERFPEADELGGIDAAIDKYMRHMTRTPSLKRYMIFVASRACA
jgi:hypothetical protein